MKFEGPPEENPEEKKNPAERLEEEFGGDEEKFNPDLLEEEELVEGLLNLGFPVKEIGAMTVEEAEEALAEGVSYKEWKKSMPRTLTPEEEELLKEAIERAKSQNE